MAQAIRTVDELGIVLGHLGADGAVGDRIDLRASHTDDLIVFDRHRKTASVRAIEGANAEPFDAHN
jgi:hypothetical protein